MKKKLQLINLSVLSAVLFAILFQSFHGMEHLDKLISEKQCFHNYKNNKTEITHHHKGLEHCFVCEFTLSSVVTPDGFTYKFYSNYQSIPYFFTAEKSIIPFSGSLYALRGPPQFIV